MYNHSFHKNIKQQNTTVFNIDYTNNVSWAANHHIKMISEGSKDTEDRSTDAENSALPSQE